MGGNGCDVMDGCEHNTITCWYPGTGSWAPSVDSPFYLINCLGACFLKGPVNFRVEGKFWNQNLFNSSTVPSSQANQSCVVNW